MHMAATRTASRVVVAVNFMVFGVFGWNTGSEQGLCDLVGGECCACFSMLRSFG